MPSQTIDSPTAAALAAKSPPQPDAAAPPLTIDEAFRRHGEGPALV